MRNRGIGKAQNWGRKRVIVPANRASALGVFGARKPKKRASHDTLSEAFQSLPLHSRRPQLKFLRSVQSQSQSHSLSQSSKREGKAGHILPGLATESSISGSIPSGICAGLDDGTMEDVNSVQLGPGKNECKDWDILIL